MVVGLGGRYNEAEGDSNAIALEFLDLERIDHMVVEA